MFTCKVIDALPRQTWSIVDFVNAQDSTFVLLGPHIWMAYTWGNENQTGQLGREFLVILVPGEEVRDTGCEVCAGGSTAEDEAFGQINGELLLRGGSGGLEHSALVFPKPLRMLTHFTIS